jgi:PEP-CTERM motif
VTRKISGAFGVVVAAGFLASLVLASNTYADPIYGTVDALVGAYDKDSSADCGVLNFPKCEEVKLEYFVGGSGGYVDPKYGNLTTIATNNGAGWVNDNDPTTNLVAFDLSKFGFPDPITYFAIKIGGGGGNGDDFFVFKNNSNLEYALIDLNAISAAAGRKITADTISHIATPEPGALLLIGVGALTATAVRRRQRSRQGQVISRA